MKMGINRYRTAHEKARQHGGLRRSRDAELNSAA